MVSVSIAVSVASGNWAQRSAYDIFLFLPSSGTVEYAVPQQFQ